MIRIPATTFALCAALAACGDGNPFEGDDATSTDGDTTDDALITFLDPGSAAQAADGIITVTQEDQTVSFDGFGLVDNTLTNFSEGTIVATTVMGESVLAVGGLSDGVGFSGISGTTDETSPVITATFGGEYTVTTSEGQTTGPIELLFRSTDFTLQTSLGDLEVDAIADGADVTGTVTFEGEEATLAGGFFPRSTFVGAFNSDEIGGVIFTEEE